MPEEMRWSLGVGRPVSDADRYLITAEKVVAWVIENGGEARYEPASYVYEYGLQRLDRAATLLVRQRDGSEATCSPGQWVVMGDDWIPRPEEHGMCAGATTFHEFTVRD